MKNIFKMIDNDITDDIRREKSFIIGTYGVLCIVSLVMTVMNVITSKGMLTYCTGIFSAFCVVNIILTLAGQKAATVGRFLFSAEVLMMFTFFLVSENPDGFSAIWICMLPSLGMFFFDRIRGSAICLAMFIIMIFLLWTPIGNSYLMYPYTATFKMRFPILFVAFHLLAFLLETLRTNAYKKMKQMQDYYKDLSAKDQLTGIFNRQGLFSEIEKTLNFDVAKKIGVVMFDIDDFKKVNDTYGHNAGDEVLRVIARIISENLSSVVCRWGGEEFLALYVDESVKFDDLENVRKSVEQYEFKAGDLKFGVTVSIGDFNAKCESLDDMDLLISKADKALYKAKNTGKNKVIYFREFPK